MKPRTAERKVQAVPAGSPALEEEVSVNRVVRSWDRFWFTPIDPVCLGLLRIFGGALILYVHLCYTFDLMSYVGGDRAWMDNKVSKYTRNDMPFPLPGNDWGPEVLYGKGSFTWSIYYHVTEPRWIYTIHFAILGRHSAVHGRPVDADHDGADLGRAACATSSVLRRCCSAWTQ